MAEERKSKGSLQEWLSPGILGAKWPNITHLIVYIKDKDGKVIYDEHYDSTDRKHAEIAMLTDSKFQQKMVRKKKVDITMTSNYSPCSDCAHKLKTFYDRNKKIIESFTIRFAFLYYIDNPANQAGLKNLKKGGIILEAMTDKSWLEVFLFIRFKKDQLELAERVRKRDKVTTDKLSELLDEEVPETDEVAGAGEEPEIEELTQLTKTLDLNSKQNKPRNRRHSSPF